jgi:hypothetical protein
MQTSQYGISKQNESTNNKSYRYNRTAHKLLYIHYNKNNMEDNEGDDNSATDDIFKNGFRRITVKNKFPS